MADVHECPVCHKYVFDEYNSMDYCDVCGWGDDAIQAKDPTYKGGQNKMSLYEARKAYKQGIPIE